MGKGIKSLITLRNIVSSVNIVHFSNYLKHQCNNSLFIKSTVTDEITNISTLNINKSSGPTSAS